MTELMIPILMYHSVGLRSDDYLTVAQDQFCRQIAHLTENYKIVPIHTFTQHLTGRSVLPPNPIVISFDDALKDNVENALPILEEYKACAIFFVIAGYVGENNAWDHKAYKIVPHMTPEDLKCLILAGHEIGNHSLTHQRLTKLSKAQLEEEFSESHRRLEALTGIQPKAFSYPYGDADEHCIRQCRKLYQFGFASVRQGVFDWTAEPMNIRRIYVAPADQPEDLDRKIACYQRGIQHE